MSVSVDEGGPQANKFEQVSSDDHQMSLAGGPMSDVGVRLSGKGRMSDIQWVGHGGGGPCTVRSNVSWVMVT